ncbi:SDR family NAD(P)-dependent oxidoreductase [Atopomonas sediminilitoris]|uniref:SDR family NAD(P)-dependent oxidoreductase n=1 Tax=Atopomonas sediminilitoris TaxID=2919919 RepID=UPI001F4ED733|nr:SDR family oxidoreductase [Atopomonas sediminilitoris]MCJ8168534.1 SDR family oxidoreductase [Atopomonas sediminilitoris]
MSAYALITGASAGIGLALAEALARQGQSLLLVARNKEHLHAQALEMQRRFGVEVLIRACDLSKPLQVTGLIQELEESNLPINLLINNAGLGTAGPFLAQEWADEKQELEVNILALTQLCHGIGGLMARQQGGKILNVASIAAFQPGPWMSSYYASKAYVLSLSEGLREELKPLGIDVSVLCPGPTRTEFFDRAGMDVSPIEGSPLMMRTDHVAQIAVKGLAKNRAIITPGLLNCLIAASPRFSPRWLVRKMAGRLNRMFVH